MERVFVQPLARSLSPTRARAYLTCPRQYRLRYVDRLRVVGPRPEPLVLGSLLHSAVAAYLASEPASEAAVIACAQDACVSASGEYAPEEIAPARDRLAGLLLELHGSRAGLRAAATRPECEVPLRGRLGAVAVFARADVLWRGEGGIVHDEYKLGAPDPAFLLLATACARLGLRTTTDGAAATIRHRLVVFRPAFGVREIALDEITYRLALRRLWDVALQIGAEREWAPRPSPAACGTCEFAASCDAAARCVDEAPF